MGRPPANPVRISALDPLVVRWIMGRARTFILVELGGRTWERPAFSYQRISRNVRLARKVSVSRFAIRRLVMKRDPELARRRHA